ncbi:MAG: hypothetical protein Q7S85_10000 [Rugosibacter sp.]|nr:hypothetical protein [Rugosibacter sp.]
MSRRQKFSALGWIFIGVFIYALSAMAVSRELVIPRFFPAAVEGHIPGDPYYYHLLAMNKAGKIETEGIQEFELRPTGQGSAGVASLAYLVYENPYGIVLINAFLHGISAVAMAMLLLKWFPLRTAIIAIVPLAISPYMMIWFSQVNKDSFAVVGALLFMYGLMQLVSADEKSLLRSGWISLLAMVAGMAFLWVVRPYVNQILLPIVAMVLVLVLLLRTIGSYRPLGREGVVFSIYGVFVLVCLGILGQGAASDKTLRSFDSYVSESKTGTVSANCLEKIDIHNWRNAQFLPDYVDNKLKAMMGQRCLIFTVLETQNNPATLRSIIDSDRLPGGSPEALYYLPRAVLLGVLSPWPEDWGYIFSNGPSFFYTIVPLEALLLYAGLVSLCFWLWRTREWSILIPVGMSVGVMSIYAMATPFLGALYRYRYPWWMLLICLGSAASLELIRSTSRGG